MKTYEAFLTIPGTSTVAESFIFEVPAAFSEALAFSRAQFIVEFIYHDELMLDNIQRALNPTRIDFTYGA